MIESGTEVVGVDDLSSGSNLHASVHVPAHDDLGHERLCRYLARPAAGCVREATREGCRVEALVHGV